MEIFTHSAQETQSLGKKIANNIITAGRNAVILGRIRQLAETTPESVKNSISDPGRSRQSSNFDEGGIARMTDGGHKDNAVILALYGELGSGKTTFTQGFAKGLGLPQRLVSPTFIIVREYPLNTKNWQRFYHVDLYRVETGFDPETLGLAEIFADPANIVVIEWAERLGKTLPKSRSEIHFEQLDSYQRRITIEKIEVGKHE